MAAEPAPEVALTIVSGGQTGVDRGALDAAIDLGVPCAGWCPRGRRAEDGVIPARYPLRETSTSRYAQRTRANVRDSDATLVLARGRLGGGTALTARAAREQGKPCRVVDPGDVGAVEAAARWCRAHRVRVLNVAGPRASQAPELGEEAYRFVRALLRALRDPRAR